MKEDLVRELMLEKIGVDALEIFPLTGGQVGSVYCVETSGQSYVVKLVENCSELEFSEEDRDDRVYGSRWSNLLPAHTLLKNNGIAVPQLYDSGYIESHDLNFVIMDYLDGSNDHTSEWFSTVGATLGAMHSVTRSYQGWVGMSTPLSENWSIAFTKSLRSQLEQARSHLPIELYSKVREYLHGTILISEPEKFVLSHPDGFQGVVKKEDSGYRLIGVVDIEDYHFTDQRLVLAGFELSELLQERVVPEEFWEAYERLVTIDSTFPTSKKTFQIFFLLVWIRVQNADPIPYQRYIRHLSNLVDGVATNYES